MDETAPKPKPTADYDVGYGKPPRHTRFKPGQSGNPRGRPRQSKTMPEAIRAAMRARVMITENGERKAVPRIEVMARQLANKAAAGDLRAMRLVADLCPEVKDAIAPMFQLIVGSDDLRL